MKKVGSVCVYWFRNEVRMDKGVNVQRVFSSFTYQRFDDDYFCDLNVDDESQHIIDFRSSASFRGKRSK